MKKNKFTEFFKGKGYYVLLFVGVIAIAAVALIGSQLSTGQKNENQDYVDLNDTDNNIAAQDDSSQVADNNQVSDEVTNNTSKSTSDTAANDNKAKDVAGNDVEYDDYSNVSGSTQKAQAADTKQDASVATEGNTVKNEDTKALEALSFNTEDGLMWPVKGNVIMDYSMDLPILFETLRSYKTNPAIIIDAEVGTEVKAAATGIVTAIDTANEETGYTVTMGIGDDFSLTYGQLDKDSVSLKVGDKVSEGDVIGKIAAQTKYYQVEGSNLYFEVTQKDKPVNPMLYLNK